MYLLVFYVYFMRICKNMCKFNPKNHYYFNDSLHFSKSYKIKWGKLDLQHYYRHIDIDCNYQK